MHGRYIKNVNKYFYNQELGQFPDPKEWRFITLLKLSYRSPCIYLLLSKVCSQPKTQTLFHTLSQVWLVLLSP